MIVVGALGLLHVLPALSLSISILVIVGGLLLVVLPGRINQP